MAGSGDPRKFAPIFRFAEQRPRSLTWRYGFAVLAWALAFVATFAVSGYGTTAFFIFPAAIVAATWFAGMWPGFVSLLLSATGILYILSVRQSPAVITGREEAVRYIVFAATAVLIWALMSALQKSHERVQRMNLRFGGVVQISEDAIISVDQNQKISLFNPGAEKIFGYQRDEILGKPLNLLIPERYRNGHASQVNGFKSAPDVLRPMGARSTIYGFRKDGTEFPAEASISKFEAAGEKILTVRLRDISDRQVAERGLRELAALVEWSDDAIVAENFDSVITSWNAAAEKMYGYSSSEVIGKSAEIIAPPEKLQEVASNVARARSGEAFRLETQRMAKDGRLMNVALTVSPIKDNEGHVVGISTIARDITDRKKLEDQLRQSQKMEAIGRLAGGIAHDFNNLLSIIVGYTYVLQSSLPEGDTLRGSADQVMHAAEKASALTRQLLAFSRRQVLQPEVISLNDVIGGIEKMLPRLIGEDIDLRTVKSPSLKRVKADPSQIEQVIMNLVVNSRDAMPEGGKLTIETTDVYFGPDEAAHHGVRSGNYVLLAVTDSGMGMDAQTRAHIFEPFFTTKEPGRGTGLGLATVYGIVSQSNGYIWVYSELGKGTTFKIYFPATTETGEPSRISQHPQLSLTGSETVLLVEDEVDLRELIDQVLTRQGYKVTTAGTGEDALTAVRNHVGHIDLLLTDVVMPQMGGQQLAEQLRPGHPEMSIIFMSGYTNNALMHAGSLEPGTAFLQKPFTPDVLLRKVREVLDVREKVRERRVI
jgi:PAS domain S-box-containing protein